MNRSEILLQIKDAEAKAQQIVKEAEERQRATIAAARKEAATRMKEADERLKAEYEGRLAKERASIASERQALLNKGREEAEAIRKRAEANVPKVITHLLQSFERTLNVAANPND